MLKLFPRSRPKRVLIFNCTAGRTGASFLGAIVVKIGQQLKAHGRDEDPSQFFDKVIFCTNVTYASGHYKGGKHSLTPSQDEYGL